MADDKAGAGGSKGWEPFEVVLVLLLAIGLLTQLQGGLSTTKKTIPVPPKKTIVVKPEQPSKETCGLTITRPSSLEKIDSSVSLIGTTNGCTWQSTSDVALYAQIIDAYGKPVSEYTTVAPTTTITAGTTIFNTTINLLGQPIGKGFLILIPATNSRDGSTSTVRIPIVFSIR